MMNTLTLRDGLAILATLALAGCVAPAPAPTPTTAPTEIVATPEASATPYPVMATPRGDSPGRISGHAWRDVCIAEQGGTAPEDLVNCVANPDGTSHADGIREDGEPVLAGVRLMLGAGACPASGLAEATTDSQGAYTFADLAPGDYCVTVDPTTGLIETVLINGGSAQPMLETPGFSVRVDSGDDVVDVDFGWDYLFAPGTVNQDSTGTCSFKASFVEDVTIPDHTRVAPGTAFVKTWKIRNDGTCSWGPDYVIRSLVFVGGDALNAQMDGHILTVVDPGDTVDVSVSLIAPAQSGEYVGEWRLDAGSLGTIGVGPNDASLTVDIVVGP